MRHFIISAFALSATTSCAENPPSDQSARDAITSLAAALAETADTYPDIISKKRMVGSQLQADHDGNYYFRYGILGRCYPRDNTQVIGDDDPTTRKVDEISCFQGGEFDVSAVATSFGRIYLVAPNPDESHRSVPPNIPDGEKIYRLGTEDTPSDVGLELTITGPKSFFDAVFEGNRTPILSDELLVEYAGKLKVREVKLWRR